MVNKKHFFDILNALALNREEDIKSFENHSELITILQTILYTKCEVNTDYADLMEFVKSSDFIRYCITGHKGSDAMFYTMESALKSVLKIDEKASGFVIHMALPMQYLLDELVEFNEKLELWMEDDGDILFQLDISPSLRPDEVWIHMLCGHQTKEK